MRLTCPVCGSQAQNFLPYGNPRRENARCPSCGVMERHRLLWLYMTQELELGSKPLRVLDVAHMEAFSARMKQLPKLNYITLDADPKRRPDIVADIQDMPHVPDNSFDLVICSHVLEHVRDDRAAMAELHRILRPGGKLLVMIPYNPSGPSREDTKAGPAERRRKFGDPTHVRLYGPDLMDRLVSAGFNVRPTWYGAQMERKSRKKYALDPNEPIFVCIKRVARAAKLNEPKKPTSGMAADTCRQGGRMNRKQILEMFAKRSADMIAAYPPRTGPFKEIEIVQENPGAVIEAAKNLQAEKKISSVLDLGCGIGRWFRFWLELIGAKKITGIEPVEALAAEADKRFEALPNVEVILGELIDLDNRSTKDGGLGRRSWDLGFTFTVLGHVPPNLIKQTADVLKKRTKRLMLIEPVRGDCFCDYVYKHDYAKLFGEPVFQRHVDRWKALLILNEEFGGNDFPQTPSV